MNLNEFSEFQEIQRQYISSQHLGYYFWSPRPRLNAFTAANPEVLACLDPSHFVLTAPGTKHFASF